MRVLVRWPCPPCLPLPVSSSWSKKDIIMASFLWVLEFLFVYGERDTLGLRRSDPKRGENDKMHKLDVKGRPLVYSTTTPTHPHPLSRLRAPSNSVTVTPTIRRINLNILYHQLDLSHVELCSFYLFICLFFFFRFSVIIFKCDI